MRKIKHISEYLLLKLFMIICNILPIFLIYFFGKILGLVIYYFIPIRRKSVKKNIKKAFYLKSDKEIDKIIKKMYQNFVIFMFEAVIMHRLKKNISKYTEFEGIEYLKEAYNKNKGVVLYTAHIGNWHIMGQQLVLEGYPINNIVKKQRNDLVFNEELKAMHRARMKTTILQRTPKNILRALKDGDVVEFLGDQDAGPDGVFIDFFGDTASTATGPALFHIKTGAPIIFAVDIRVNTKKHKIFIEKIDYTPTFNIKQDIREISLLLSKKLETYITKYPDQYFWLHHRWWTRPVSRRET